MTNRIYHIEVDVIAPSDCAVSNDAFMSGVVGAFSPQASEVLSVNVEVRKDDANRASFVKFNLNDKVRVRLTPVGRLALQNAHQEFYKPTGSISQYVGPVEDADGWSVWQLWRLMHDLGPYCYMGGQLPLETGIELVVE